MSGERFFFVHIMKTGGATFRTHIRRNFGEGEVYPDEAIDTDIVNSNQLIRYLLDLPTERRAKLRAYTGHFPFVVTELLDEELVTLTMLRHPVDRTISYLKHCKRYHDRHRDLALEEIYEDPFSFPCFIRDHQAKVFSMRADDKLESYMDVIDVDDRRLAEACDNLEKIDVLGLHERYGEFHDELAHRYGWRFGPVGDRRVGDQTVEVSEAFRKRIAHDNPADMAFYEYACDHYQRRRQAAT